MSILIVDDSQDAIILTRKHLKNAGYQDIASCRSASEAMAFLGLSGNGVLNRDVELILMDVMMPEMDGIELTALIKQNEAFQDIPIIMLTAHDAVEDLQLSFAAGAMDYVRKPFNRDELSARIRSALTLKRETDLRKTREKELTEALRQLEETNRMLERLSTLDGLTNIANRRFFDDFLEREWRRAARSGTHLAVIMADVDHFKLYNDTYGHQLGDDALKRTAAIMKESVHRPGDLVARYGGEEFVVVLQDTAREGAIRLATEINKNIFSQRIPHSASSFGFLTISAGVSSVVPTARSSPELLVRAADMALYKAKDKGRNMVVYHSDDSKEGNA